MNGTHLIETDRLRLRPLRDDDLPTVHALWTDPDVRHFLFDEREISLADARGFVEASAEAFESRGYGMWLFFERATDELAGFAGFVDTDGVPFLIYGTRPGLWGRGYAREAARAVLEHGFERAGLARIVADVDEPNAASIRVLEALGMRRTGRAIVNERPLLYFEITREDSR